MGFTAHGIPGYGILRYGSGGTVRVRRPIFHRTARVAVGWHTPPVTRSGAPSSHGWPFLAAADAHGELFAALVNALQDGLFVVDSAGDVIEVNEAFTAILGYGSDGLPYPAPHPWWPDPVADPEGALKVAAALATVQALGRGRHLLPLRHRDGRALWVDCSADSAPGSDGRGRLIVGVLRDVTAHRRVADRDRLFAETGRLLAQPAGLMERLAAFVKLTAPVLADFTLVSLAGPDGLFTPVAAAHRSRPEIAATVLGLAPHRIPDALVPRYLAGRAFVLPAIPEQLIRDWSADPADLAARRSLTARSSLVVPLLGAGRLLGSLSFVSTGQARAHGDSDIALADELGRWVAGVVEADRIATREHQLLEATAALSAAATVLEAAAAVGAAVRSAMGAAGIAVYIVHPDDPSRLQLTRADGYPPELAQTSAVIHTAAATPVADAARTGTAVWLGDKQAWEDRYPHLVIPGVTDDAHAISALPLQIRGRLLGVLAASFPTARTFPPDERSFALAVAAQAAQAMDRAATADARWQIARTLQRGLLPRGLPELPRLALAAHYLPAGRHTQAGGDWYDIITLGPEEIAIVVGDVVGHGSWAAAVMGQLRSALAAYLLDGHGPAGALARLGRFARRIDGASGSTVICLVLHTGTGALRWARAGHPPPLIVGPAGARFLDDAHGAVLGLLDPPPFTEATTTIAPGSSVILYTDGLVERRGEVIDDGLDRLVAVGGPHHAAAPAELLTAVLDHALGRAGAHDRAGAPDDVALIVARLLPAPLHQRLRARPEQLAVVRRTIEAWSAAAALPRNLTEDLQLAIGEAVTNSVEHAFAGRDPGWFSYRIDQVGDGRVHVEISDDGCWRPVPAEAGYRGRGLAMIGALGQDVMIDTGGPGTRIGFTLAAPATAGPVAAATDPARLSRPQPGIPPLGIAVHS